MKKNLGYRILSYLGRKEYLNFLSDELYLKIMFKRHMGNSLDLNNPKTFNEKLQWLKINDRQARYSKMADKYEVRKYIEKKIGKEFLIPTYGVFDNWSQIDFDKLPKEFVLKCTHDSGSVLVCKDKSRIDFEKQKKIFNKSLKRNYYYYGREWPYKNIKPRIICEKYMKDSEEELKDYKIMIFNGKVKCLFVCSERNSENGLKLDFFDREWNKMPFERHYKNSGKNIKKPNNLNLMIELAEKLADNMPFVRIDFYEIMGKVYFGEITFYPGSGIEAFTPEKYDYELGDWIKLN